MLIKHMVVIILQCKHISNHYSEHLELIQYVIYISILKKKKIKQEQALWNKKNW